MRHKVAGFKLGRTTSHRRSLLRNMVTSLIVEERIETTIPKAKALRPQIEKMITLGKRGDLSARRQAAAYVMTDAAVRKLFDTLGPRYGDRNGGYVRIIRAGWQKGDGSDKAFIELLGSEQVQEEKRQKRAEARAKKAEETKKAVPMESWSLVRTQNKEVGWVLSRNLIMSIPDEVAQYAEGKRITSYFDLGTVNDEEKGPKHNWLWTTVSGQEAFDFDSWRVFLWNRRRHRYETSYRQREVEGYFPVHVDPPDTNAFGRTFELICKDDDGKMRRRTYLFDGVRVHLTGTEDYHPGAAVESSGQRLGSAKASQPGWFRRQWDALKSRLFRK
jgi:large subunit ribosomal protein L17